MKSYTGLQLALRAMTLDDIERQNRRFCGFSAILGGDTHFKSECAETTSDRLGQPTYKIFTVKLNLYELNFGAFGQLNDSSHVRPLAYVNE